MEGDFRLPGQHHDEFESTVSSELDLPVPDVRLHPNASSRALRLGDMMAGIEQAIVQHAPNWVLVFGDTDSTLAGAWAAAAQGVPLVHVEAGLRSHQWSMPEEVNRVLTDRMSSVLVCPTDAAVAHLEAEGIRNVQEGRAAKPDPTTPIVLRTGDVMHDNALHSVDNGSRAGSRPCPADDAPAPQMWTRFRICEPGCMWLLGCPCMVIQRYSQCTPEP